MNYYNILIIQYCTWIRMMTTGGTTVDQKRSTEIATWLRWTFKSRRWTVRRRQTHKGGPPCPPPARPWVFHPVAGWPMATCWTTVKTCPEATGVRSYGDATHTRARASGHAAAVPSAVGSDEANADDGGGCDNGNDGASERGQAGDVNERWHTAPPPCRSVSCSPPPFDTVGVFPIVIYVCYAPLPPLIVQKSGAVSPSFAVAVAGRCTGSVSRTWYDGTA